MTDGAILIVAKRITRSAAIPWSAGSSGSAELMLFAPK
jgi:hypothetical protein